MEEISLRDIINYFISKAKIIFLLIMCVFLAGLILTALTTTTKYTNYSTIMINQVNTDKIISIDAKNNALHFESDNREPIPVYTEILKSRPVMRKTIEMLNLTYTQEELLKMIEVEIVPSTNLVKIHITTGKSAEEAAIIANSVAQVFKTEVDEGKDNVTITIIDEAKSLIEVKQSNIIKASVLLIIIGMVVSFVVVFIIYYFDNTIKSEKEIEALSKLNILGTLPHIKDFNQIAINDNTNSFVSDKFKLIKTNLSFRKRTAKLKSILITSPSKNEGKKFIATNLAIVYALENKNVLLVDADLREGKLHEAFDLKNDGGLSEILASKKMDLKNKINKTKINNLDIITCGNYVINSNELLVLKFEEFIKAAEKAYDLVVVASPPVETISDGVVISKSVDGTLLIVSHYKTDLKKLIETKKVINNVGDNIVGVVFNKNQLLKEKNKGYYID